MSPGICTVIRNKDWDIPNDFDSLFVGIGAQFAPLAEEYKLIERISQNTVCMIVARFLHHRLFSPTQRFIPPAPGTATIRFLQGHEESVIVQPRCVLPTKRIEFFAKILGCRR